MLCAILLGSLCEPDNCRSMSLLRTAHSTTFSTRSSTDPLLASFVTESADIMSETINNLNADIHFLECQIRSIFSTIYSILRKLFPGPVLSTLLRRHTAAITIRDVLTELMSSQSMLHFSIVYHTVIIFHFVPCCNMWTIETLLG